MRPFFLFLLLLVTLPLATACLDGEEKCDDDNEQRCVNGQWTKTKHCDYGCDQRRCIQKTINCNIIKEGSINIIFSGLGFVQNDLTLFEHNIRNAIDFAKNNQGILAYEPFTSNAELFGFASIDDITLTDFEKIKKACTLTNPYYIVLMNKERFPTLSPSADFQGIVYFPTFLQQPSQCEDLLNYCTTTDTNNDGCSDAQNDADFNRDGKIDATDFTIRKVCAGSRYGCSDQQSVIAYCYPLNGVTLAHEFGHAFGNLLDEYVDLPQGQTPEARLTGVDLGQAQNCYFGSAASCATNAPWKDLVGKDGAGCYPGCAYTPTAFRPTEKGIMNDYTVQRYGLVEEHILCEKIKQLTGEWRGICTQFEPSFWKKLWQWILNLLR